MKKRSLIAFILVMLIAAVARGQYSMRNELLVMKEIHDGKVCDSCLVTMAGSIGANAGQVSFLTPNRFNQFLYTDSTLTSNFSTTRNSQFYVAMGQFSLDFYPFASVNFPKKGETPAALDFSDLEFKTSVSGKPKTDWAGITSLPSDPDFYFGLTSLNEVNDHATGIETIPAKHYFAGKFELGLHDSLTVTIRNKHTRAEVYTFSITRVRSVPDYFEFIQFPAAKSFQEILNTEVNKRRMEQGPAPAHYEMEAGNSAFLRFANDEQYYFFGRTPRNSGVEYAIDKPDHWKRLSGDGDTRFLNGFTYIYLENPASDRTMKVFLRYHHQPESVHEVTIHVKTVPGVARWITIVFLLSVVSAVALVILFIQKQRYKRRIARLTRKKSEIENQLQLLSGQLNPHFLFNSLNAVQSLIRRNDPEAASQYITDVATFMRTIMDSGKKELISLQEELQTEERYIALEQKRRPFSYTFENRCQADLAEIDFPPLLLQPIIENSIRHGFAETITNPSLAITVRCDARDLTVTIADNGTGLDSPVNATGHGLSLSNKRIALINEKLAPMQVIISTKSTRGIGTVTEIRLLQWLS